MNDPVHRESCRGMITPQPTVRSWLKCEDKHLRTTTLSGFSESWAIDDERKSRCRIASWFRTINFQLNICNNCDQLWLRSAGYDRHISSPLARLSWVALSISACLFQCSKPELACSTWVWCSRPLPTHEAQSPQDIHFTTADMWADLSGLKAQLLLILHTYPDYAQASWHYGSHNPQAHPSKSAAQPTIQSAHKCLESKKARSLESECAAPKGRRSGNTYSTLESRRKSGLFVQLRLSIIIISESTCRL